MYAKIPRKVWQDANYVLDPEAGEGHILEYIKKKFGPYEVQPKLHAIEKDERLVATLKGKGFPVIDRDFLAYSGTDKYDIIIANPPFSQGAYHLLKMIDVMYSGHIVCLLNSSTIKNPCNHVRKMLVRKLTSLEASIEYHQNCFKTAERPTGVEIALVHIFIDRKIEEDLFDNLNEATDPEVESIEEPRELVEKGSIRNLVADYNRIVEIGTQSLLDHYKNYRHIAPFLKISIVGEDNDLDNSNLTKLMKTSLNLFLIKVRKVYWNRLLELDTVYGKMTSKRINDFRTLLQKNEIVDFTESNIKAFIINLMKGYDAILTEATVDIFDKMTVEHAWDKDIHFGNVHYFNGWVTNKAFFVNEKVVIPMGWSPFFDKDFGRWKIDWQVKNELDDIDKVMNSFDGATEYTSIAKALEDGFKIDKTRKLKSTYFEITVFKKGTIHLTFLSEDIRRRFNVTACRGKNWLPQDYGKKKYSDMTPREKLVVDNFEGEKQYNANVSPNARLFRSKAVFQIPHVPETIQKAA